MNPENEYVERFVADVDMTKVLTAKDVMKKADPVIFCKSGPHLAARLMKIRDPSSSWSASTASCGGS